MIVTVRAFGSLLNYMPEMAETLTLQCDENVRVANVVSQLRLPDYAIWIITVNGEKVEPSHRLKDGDLLSLFAPVAGG